ncbi:ABC transporter substrate-binding protein [Trichocoleus desertorum AS-A10]|uniref:ABC transporter substrate-binding protein n=1 Tax=Trichocoleus desertorum TaxID=1481672 RepID=UPI003297F6F5
MEVIQKRSKLLRQLHTPQFWGLMAGVQIAVLLLLWLTWPQAPVNLTLVVPAPESQHWAGLIQDFQAQNPDIRIKLVEGAYTTNEVEAIYTSALQTGSSSYDLIYLDIIWTPKFAAAGWLSNLSDYVSSSDLTAFLTDDIEAGRYQGALYRIPFRTDVGMLYYRKDLLEQIGNPAPETFAELVQVSQKLQQQQQVRWGYVWQGQQYEGLAAMFVEVLAGYGGFWIDPNTREVGLDQAPAIQAVEFLRNTLKLGISPAETTTYNEEESFEKFQQGEVAFLRNWPYIWPRVQAVKGLQDQVGIKPMVHAPGYRSAACKGGWGFGIAKNAKHPQEAWRAIQFFTSVESQRQFVLQSGYLPTRRNLFVDRAIAQKYPHFPSLLTVLEHPVLRPLIPQYDQASQILQRHLSAALTGQPSAEAAMQAAAQETRRLLAKNY